VEALEELMKTVDGSKYSVHASSILESHDVSEPAATQSAVASSQVKCFTLTTTATQAVHKVGEEKFPEFSRLFKSHNCTFPEVIATKGIRNNDLRISRVIPHQLLLM